MRVEPDARLDVLTNAVIGAAMEVHRRLGPGLLESAYEGALSVELGLRGISFRRQVRTGVSYKGFPVGQARIDLLIAEELVVELKAESALAPVHRAQILGYLRALDVCLGLILNFNVPRLRDGISRVVRTP